MQNITFEKEADALLEHYKTQRRVREKLGYTDSGWKAARKAPNERIKAVVHLAFVNLQLSERVWELETQLESLQR